ncbi:hypothetical protein AMS68_002741 [Peltaster fructicola]|uniref:Glycerophosphocholine acyltransferase 1 n=1 Tax=Peltaster fructicola TaxID=286661 RepID=A0A6H0XR59_9PEZI|nr:hypothetical protein AMS68_002741 [Peltaster fructicola]
MALNHHSSLRRPYYAGHGSSYLDLVDEEHDSDFSSEYDDDKGAYSSTKMGGGQEEDASGITDGKPSHKRNLSSGGDYLTAQGSYSGLTTPGTPGARSTTGSDLDGSFDAFGNDNFPPVDRLSMFDILENLALPQRLERMQNAISQRADKVRAQRRKLTQRAMSSRNNLVDEWRKRVPPPEEQLQKYRRRMKETVDRLGRRWNNAKTVTLKEKISFVTAVLNIFISGYLIGAYPEWFHIWYTVQLAYFMPIRWYNYHKIGLHYFLADLCYFVNLLLVLSIWFYPQSKRLLISTYCLAFGNNAIAIIMWRNSLVFHSLDKVTSLFIHIMPCATLHVLVHLIPKEMQQERFPAIYTIKYSLPGSPEHYRLLDMIVWATLPYAFWQLSYHFLITVRKRAQIAAGRPTSFTWLRRSYRANFLGKFVLGFPDIYQEPIFMMIQYVYALLTLSPCPIWFWSRWASATFMMVVLSWASWNGATYYIDVFGRRMEKELNELRKQVERLSKSPDMRGEDGTGSINTPLGSPNGPQGVAQSVDGSIDGEGKATALDLGSAALDDNMHRRGNSIDSTLDSDGRGGMFEDMLTPGLMTPGATTPGLELKNVRFSADLSGQSIDGGARTQAVPDDDRKDK